MGTGTSIPDCSQHYHAPDVPLPMQVPEKFLKDSVSASTPSATIDGGQAPHDFRSCFLSCYPCIPTGTQRSYLCPHCCCHELLWRKIQWNNTIAITGNNAEQCMKMTPEDIFLGGKSLLPGRPLTEGNTEKYPIRYSNINVGTQETQKSKTAA